MTCQSCGYENPEGARFCGECARPLAAAIVCTNCGASNPRTQKFCNGCAAPLSDAAMATALREPRTYTPKHLAEKILTSRSALEGERSRSPSSSPT